MVVLIYIASVLGWVVLDRQSRRHAIERDAMCRSFGLPIEIRGPRVPRLESIYTVIIGAFFCALGIAFIVFLLGVEPSERPSGVETTAGVVFAVGLGYAVLGFRALRENSRIKQDQAVKTKLS
jgi:hypothetical protein